MCIQQIPSVFPTNQYTTIAPLAVVLLAPAFKEVQEDFKRYQSDSELNARLGKAPSGNNFVARKWKDLCVGDVVRVESDEFIPANLVLISSSEPEGSCYTETSNLNGFPTNLLAHLPIPRKRFARVAPIKRTAVECQVNIHIIFLFIFLALSLRSTIGASINTLSLSGQQWYLVKLSTFAGKGDYLFRKAYSDRRLITFQQAFIKDHSFISSTYPPLLTQTLQTFSPLSSSTTTSSIVISTTNPHRPHPINSQDYATKACALFASHIATSQRPNTCSGPPYTSKPLQLSTAAQIPSTVQWRRRIRYDAYVINGWDQDLGDRQETAINIGKSCRLVSESMNLVIVNENNSHDTADFFQKRLSAIKNQRSMGELEDLALVIDDKSQGFALEKELSKSFLELALMRRAVICCRVSPLQKALVIKLVKKNQKSMILAIGDGANDVSMIQAAHVGVGISGVERSVWGLQAARSADVAISQFRFLKKLLLVHGAWSCQRLSKLILYTFYKNITLYMTQFWYSFFNNFSGQIAYESWTISSYNVIFTVLPPLVIGVFDQFVSARILDRYLRLYALGQKNVFTKTTFWLWVGNALYHSLILFTFTVILFWGDLKQATGLDSGHWFWGAMLYLAVLLTVLGKAALVSDLWTKHTVAAIPGSLVFTMLFLPLYTVVVPAIGFSTEYYGLVLRLWTDAVFYFVLNLVPIVCLTRDFIRKYYRRTYIPLPYKHSRCVSDRRMDDTKDMVIEIEDTSYESMLIGNTCVIPAPKNKNQNDKDTKSNDATNCVLIQ
ncbi:phospholipid-translocating P-type ATPase [Suillus weaverae]|nr:phospholipid-translocating P-type ATPase [Suillus weaverae]